MKQCLHLDDLLELVEVLDREVHHQEGQHELIALHDRGLVVLEHRDREEEDHQRVVVDNEEVPQQVDEVQRAFAEMAAGWRIRLNQNW